MINLSLIYHYNRLLAYTRNRYHPWNETERKELKESAPLLKFAMHKNALDVENENILHIKALAKYIKSNRMIISSSIIQLHIDQQQPVNLANIKSFFETPKSMFSSMDVFNREGMVEIYIYGRFGCLLTDGSKQNGLYELVGSDWVHTRTSTKIIKRLYELGFVSVRARTPLACPVDRFSKADIEQSTDLVEFCASKNYKSASIESFIKILTRNIKKYRWPGQENLIKTINKHIQETQ